jgi:RNase P subunit RPR2
MGRTDTLPPAGVADLPVTTSVCRCGHCRTVIDVVGKHQRVHCPECGRSNALPSRVYVTCARCDTGQRIPFDRRDDPPLCVNCAHSFQLHEVELVPQQRHTRVHGGRGQVRRRDGAAFTILLYGAALILFLIWLMRR